MLTLVSGSVEHIVRDAGWEFGVLLKAQATAGREQWPRASCIGANLANPIGVMSM
jgi:hypothetical protein